MHFLGVGLVKMIMLQSLASNHMGACLFWLCQFEYLRDSKSLFDVR